jgi:hypothetical protein
LLVVGTGDPVRLQEMDDHRRHHGVFIWFHFSMERRQEIVQGGLNSRRRGRQARWTGSRGYWSIHWLSRAHDHGRMLHAVVVPLSVCKNPLTPLMTHHKWDTKR